MSRFTLLLLTILLPLAISAQDLAASHQKIATALEERNYLLVKAELLDLRTREKDAFEANNYDYLLARVSEKSGDAAAAMAAYQAVAKRDSVLKEYALWHLSQLARTSGNLLLERIHLQELIAFAPDSRLHDPARIRLARSFFESADYGSVIKLITSPVASESSPKGTVQVAGEAGTREERVLLGESFLKAGDAAKAREQFTALISTLPNPAQPDDFALAAVRGLDSLDAGSPITAITDYEHLRRAQIYQFNRDFKGARVHFLAILNNFPGSGIVPDAIYQIGRGYSQESQFVEAITWYERALEQHTDHAIAKDALLQLASAYTRVGKHREAVSRYKIFIERYPDDERLDRAYLNIVDVLRDNREETEALKAAAVAREKFKGKLPEALAVFAEARIRISGSEWAEALAALETLGTFPELGGAAVSGGTTSAEVTFLRALVLEELRRYSEAIDVYLSIPDGRNEYYGGRATDRLRLLASTEHGKPLIAAKLKSLRDTPRGTDGDGYRRNLQSAIRLTATIEDRTKLLDELKKVYGELPAYKDPFTYKLTKLGRQAPIIKGTAGRKDVAGELLFLGLYDEAAPELEAALRAEQKIGKTKTDIDYTIADLYRRGDIANRSSAFIEPIWKVPADYQVELIPDDVLRMLYPTPYVEALLKSGPPRNVDPRFLLSIMRQESRYRSDAKSYAAARGLMQFISSTASRIAGELGRGHFSQDELYDPPTAVLFGSQYVGNLQKLFPNQLPAVAAGYNGGEDNMKRWMLRSKSDTADRYVPEIGFGQTKDYVYRVMANYRMYSFLYDENLKRIGK